MFVLTGYNVRPTEIQAAIASVQLKKLPEMLAARRKLAMEVKERLPGWLELTGADNPGNSWMTLPLRVKVPGAREHVVRHFESHGVDTRPVIAGNLVRHPAMKHVQHRCAPSLAVADSVLADCFMIGCHPVMTDEARGTLWRTLDGLQGILT
jgi:CDP-6-deoxy-D-xylo-4-hexulose-3-dehydrase